MRPRGYSTKLIPLGVPAALMGLLITGCVVTAAPTPTTSPAPAPAETPEADGALGGGQEPTTDSDDALELEPNVVSRVESLIQDLSSDNPQDYLRAGEELTQIGAPALPQLQAAAENPDLTVEQRTKLEGIIAAIELRQGTPGAN